MWRQAGKTNRIDGRAPEGSAVAVPGEVVYRFAPFELVPGLRELRRDGRPVALQPQPYRALELLVAADGRVVTRDEFVAALWETGTHVDYDRGIISTIRRLRVVLGDDARAAGFIRTLPGHGYRFVGATRVVRGAVADAPAASARLAAETATHSGDPPRRDRRPRTVTRRLLGVAATLLSLVAVGWAITAGTRDRSASRLVAVLPMTVAEDAAIDPGLGEALTEQIAIELSRLGPAGLRVVAPQSARRFAERRLSLEDVRANYEVAFVVGSSLRVVGGRTEVNVSVVRTDDGSILWGDRYPVGASRFGERNLAVAVREGVGAALGANRNAGSGHQATYPPELAAGVAELLAVARFHAYRGTAVGYREAVAAYEAAVALQPALAPAWAGLAESHAALGIWFEVPVDEVLPPAREAASRALALDPALAEAHAVDGLLALYYDWDWARASVAFRRALDLNPSSARAFSWKAAAHSILGEHDAAVAAARQALVLDPLSESVTAGAGWTYLRAGRPREAVDHCRRTYELTPDHPHAKTCLIHAYEALGRFDAELDELTFYARPTLGEERFARLIADGAEQATRGYWRYLFDAYAVDGRRPWRTALFAALAGHEGDALVWLERAFEQRAPQLAYLEVDPRLAGLRDEPRFALLSARVGLR